MGACAWKMSITRWWTLLKATRLTQVEISDDGREISSNDSASYWQGYLGYPAIAVLLMRGLYRPPANVIDALAGIPWKEINRRNKNDYEKTLAEVNQIVEASGHDPDAIASEVESMMEALRKFAPMRGKRRRPPAESQRPRRKKPRRSPEGRAARSLIRHNYPARDSALLDRSQRGGIA